MRVQEGGGYNSHVAVGGGGGGGGGAETRDGANRRVVVVVVVVVEEDVVAGLPSRSCPSCRALMPRGAFSLSGCTRNDREHSSPGRRR